MIGYQSHSAQDLFQGIRSAVDTNELSRVPGGAPFGINYRTLGNVAYFMLSLNTPSHLVRTLEDKLWHVLTRSLHDKVSEEATSFHQAPTLIPHKSRET